MAEVIFKTYDQMVTGETQVCPLCKHKQEKGSYFLARKYNGVRSCDGCQDRISAKQV